MLYRRTTWRLGSPPRARGKGHGDFAAAALKRITPACAGKSYRPAGDRRHPWDHPRVRGEKLLSTFGTPLMVGSPPRARGKGVSATDDGPLAGITPACAGKSCGPAGSRFRRPDHPRVRGEKCTEKGIVLGCPGSPPRARGKAAVKKRPRAGGGITPACAGKSFK